MSQKIHPISNKLGITKLWKHSFSIYGQNFKTYLKIITPYKYIFDYINLFCFQHNLLIEKVIFNQTSFSIDISIFTIQLKTNKTYNKNKVFNIISKWLNTSFRISFYINFNTLNSALLIKNYVNFLFGYKTNSPKKILQNVYKVIKNQKNKVQIKYTTLGIKTLKLKGFKMEISGCFEASRSQMSKTIKCNFGIVPLTKLNGYIDYSNATFYTKFGACGLKIWLFYEYKV